MTTNYERGAARERAFVEFKEKNGWTCVRSAGSHGAVDVVCWRGNSIEFNQLKGVGHKKEGREELKAMKAIPWNSTKFLVWKEKYSREWSREEVG